MERRVLVFAFVLLQGLLIAVWGPGRAEASAQAALLSVAEMVELRRIGFSEAEIKGEIQRAGGSYELTDGQLSKLREAGFSKGFLDYLQSLKPKKRLTNNDIAGLVRRGLSAEEILKQIQAAERAFDPSPQALLQLGRQRVPKAVLRAMRPSPLTAAEVSELAAEGVPAGQLVLLLEIAGFDAGPEFGPGQALQLVRAGIPMEVVARLRAPQVEPGPTAPDLPRPGYYPHPLGLFALYYPETWALMRQIEDGNVMYAVTPERGLAKLDDATVGFQVFCTGMGEDALIAGLKPPQALSRLLPLLQQHEPGIRPEGPTAEARMGDLAAGRQTFLGTLRKKPGEYRVDLYLGLREGFMCLALAGAPTERFREQTADFERILKESSFLPGPPEVGPGRQLGANEAAARYKAAVVSITSFRGDQALGTGSGFVVREDGYVITNHHVIWDDEKDRPATRFTVEWDDDLKRPRKEARLEAYKRTVSPIMLINWGIDVALLKLPDDVKYETIPLTPLSQVRLGDPVLTMGFPARGTIPTLSTIITSGIVTRINKDFRGRIESIYTDAPTAHGSSGGPCLSLTTGGVIGLNTYGVDVKLAQRIPGSENLVNYHGVVPIDAAMHEFPLATRISTAREKLLDFLDYFDLALRSADLGSASAALRMAEKGVAKSERSADAHALQGMLQVVSGTDKAAVEAGFKTLEKALGYDSKHLESLLFLAEVKMQAGEVLEAVRYADRAVEAVGDDWRSYEKRARVNLAAKRYAEALRDLDQAKALSRRTLPGPYLLAGEAYYGMGRTDEGRAEFLKAVELHPASLEARMGVARFYVLGKSFVSALLEYDRINRDHPDTPAVLAAMASCYRQIRKFDKAIEHYQNTIVRSRQLSLVAPEQVFMEAGETAWKDLNQPKLAILLYTQYLVPYFEAEKAFDVHLNLGKIFEGADLSKGIAKGHLIRAYMMRQQDETVQKEIKRLNVNLSKADIALMLKLHYEPELAAQIIAVTPLDFQVRTKEDIQGLLNEFPKVVVVGILESQKAYEEIRKKQEVQEKPQKEGKEGKKAVSEGAPTKLVGTWAGPIVNPYNNMPFGQLQLVLQADGRFESQTTLMGTNERDTGTFELTETTLVLNSDTGRRSSFVVRFQGPKFLVSIPQLGEVAMSRIK